MNGEGWREHQIPPPIIPSAGQKASGIERPERLTPPFPPSDRAAIVSRGCGFSATASSFPGFARASIHRATRGTRHDRGGSTQPVPSVHPACEAEGLVYRGTEGLPPRSPRVSAQRSSREIGRASGRECGWAYV